MREASTFIFDGESSEDMGVMIASPEVGLYEEAFFPTRTIVETKIPGKDNPYYQRVEMEPLSFPLTIFIHEWRERDNARQIARWLCQSYYKPLIFDTNLNRIYYAIFDGDSRLIHNGAKDGYITLNVRCSSPFSYSYPKSSKDEIRDMGEMTIYNTGDVDIKPKMWIKKVGGDGSIQIENLTTSQVIRMDNLQNNEEVFVDFDKEEIVSSLEYLTVYRYDDHNNEWLILESNLDGENRLKFTGDFDVQFEYEMKYLSEWR